MAKQCYVKHGHSRGPPGAILVGGGEHLPLQAPPGAVCTNGRLPVAIPIWPPAARSPKTSRRAGGELLLIPAAGSLSWARGGGRSAQESDDITGQPLKDELFPVPLQLSSSEDW